MKCCHYRSIIQACQQETESLKQVDEKEKEEGKEPSAREDLVALQDILCKMELILSLVELLFVDTVSGEDQGIGETHATKRYTKFVRKVCSWMLVQVHNKAISWNLISDGHLLNQLVKWIQLHFPQHEKKKRVVLQCDRPHLHTDYWNTVRVLLSCISALHRPTLLY